MVFNLRKFFYNFLILTVIFTMTAIATGRVEANTNSLQISDNGGKRRSCTNKYWNFLFIILLIVWLALGRDVVVRHKSDCQVNSNNSTVSSNNQLKFFTNKTDCKSIPENQTFFINDWIEDVSKVWGKYWIFDVITCNIGFLDRHYEKCGSIVTWAHILMSICLITHATISMRTDGIFYWSLRFCSLVIISTTWSYRLIYRTCRPIKDIEVLPYEKNITWWIAPELILLCVRATTELPRKSDVLEYSKKDGAWERYHKFVSYMFAYLGLLFLSFVITALVDEKYDLNWDNSLTAYSFVGITCYFCLILHYFALLVTSCATGISSGLDRNSYKIVDYLRAWIIVARYHFGTACYRATLILPRIEATFVANKREFRDIPNYSAIYRLYLTHWRIHDITLMMTASRGLTYSESIKELLWLFRNDASKAIVFQTHSQVAKRETALLIGVNNLLLIGLWTHGVVLDSRFLVGTWIMHLNFAFFTWFTGKVVDTVADVFWLDYNGYLKKRL